MEKSNRRFSTRFIAYTGLMAAVCFAATYIHLNFSLAGGGKGAMIHLGSAAGFLAALLFGGLSGGLAGGIGMGLYDVLNGWATTSPFTFVFKFITGFVIGKIAFSGGKYGDSQKRNLVACLAGAGVTLVLYAVQKYVTDLITLGNAKAALIDTASEVISSLVTSAIAIIIAVPFNDSIRKALKGSHLLKNH